MKSKGEKTVLTAADYRQWIVELKTRYRATQIKAAIAVNSALIDFYWNLGKDISEKYPGKKRGADFFGQLSRDLLAAIPDSGAFSVRNLKYMLNFYELYAYRQQLVADKEMRELAADLICVPWGHHIQILTKCKSRDQAIFYVRRTIQNGWSRNTLLNWLSTDLYEREGKGQTNFALTMPSDDCDLAQGEEPARIEKAFENPLPENALCLAATYAAAFKNHLITFDEDMRLVLSSSLTDHATSDAFRHTFKAYEGQRMLPVRYIQSSDVMMRVHREALVA